MDPFYAKGLNKKDEKCYMCFNQSSTLGINRFNGCSFVYSWERLVSSMKCLIKNVGLPFLSYQKLDTQLIEIEAVVNAVLLTYMEDDLQGISHPLTPPQLVNI